MEGLMNDETRASQRQRNALECPMLPLAHYVDQAGLGYLVFNVLPVDVDFDARINNASEPSHASQAARPKLARPGPAHGRAYTSLL